MRNTINFNGGDYVCVRNLLSCKGIMEILYSLFGYLQCRFRRIARERERGRERESDINFGSINLKFVHFIITLFNTISILLLYPKFKSILIKINMQQFMHRGILYKNV